MPYIATRRQYDVYNRKVSRNLVYRKAKQLYHGGHRGFEMRFFKTRLSHA